MKIQRDKMNGKTRLFLCAGILLGVLLGAGLWKETFLGISDRGLPSEHDVRPGAQAGLALGSERSVDLGNGDPAEKGRAPGPGLGLEPGSRLVYRFSEDKRIQMSLDVDIPDKGAMDASLRVRHSGHLAVEVYGDWSVPKGGDGWLVGFRFMDVDARVEQNGQPLGPDHPIMTNGIYAVSMNLLKNSSVVVEVFKDGRIGRMNGVLIQDENTRGIWRSILSHWGVVLHPDDQVRRWSATEVNGTGYFKANYTKAGEALPFRLERKWNGYSRHHREQNENMGSTEEEGSFTYEMNPYPTAIQGCEISRLRVGGMAAAEISAAVEMKLLSANMDPAVRMAYAAVVKIIDAGRDPLAWEPNLQARNLERSEQYLATAMDHLGKLKAIMSRPTPTCFRAMNRPRSCSTH